MSQPSLRDRIATLICRELPPIFPPLIPADCARAAEAVIAALQGVQPTGEADRG